tara:strand:- start:745 stop:1686 length:942 start_codon:yes stop_codon:yes gene_type:complete
MANKGKKILKKQNRLNHIDELLAQKTIYSRAKNYQGLLIFITVLLPILVSILIKLDSNLIDQSNYIFALYLVLGAVGEKILEKVIDRLKNIAASIQEQFDCDVLDIEKNETINSMFIDKESIRRYSKKARKNTKLVEKVTDWYSLNLKAVKTNIASLLCQRTNITYDFSIRSRYKNAILILTILTFTVLLIIAFYNDLTLKTFLIEVILPSIPVIMFAYKEINSNIESIDNLNHLRHLIESELSGININSEIDETLLRKIQDRIYQNRILSPLIPDFIYYFVRTKLEDEMNYSVEAKLEILRTTKHIAKRSDG